VGLAGLLFHALLNIAERATVKLSHQACGALLVVGPFERSAIGMPRTKELGPPERECLTDAVEELGCVDATGVIPFFSGL
jgi:hypothetical protein